MADQGHGKGWGLGRHVLGSNYFHYVQDPWGRFAEYSCDIATCRPVPPDSSITFRAVDHLPRFSLYQKGY